MAQRLQFTYDMARGMCNLNNTELGLLFRSITELIYEGKEPNLPDKLLGMYYILKPYLDDDIERHIKYVESKTTNGKLGGRPKASFVDNNYNQSKKPKKAKEPKEAKEPKKATDNDNDIYNTNIDIIYNNIKEKDFEKLKKEFPEKNFEIEIKKMCNNWAGKNKKIQKPVQALRNWLLPKKWDNDYIGGIDKKTDDQWITEFLSGKMKFHDKYGWDKYQEVKDLWIKKCLAQPLVL